MRSRLGIAVLVGACLATGACGLGPNDLDGQVIDEMGNSVDGATVWIDGAITKTSGGGRFALGSVGSSYTATVSMPVTAGSNLTTFVALTTRRPVLHVRDPFRMHPSIKYAAQWSDATDAVGGCAFTNEFNALSTTRADGRFEITGSHTGGTSGSTRIVAFPFPLPVPTAPVADTVVVNSGVEVDAGRLTPSMLPTAVVTWRSTTARLASVRLEANDGTRCFIHTSDESGRVIVPVIPNATARLVFTDGWSSVAFSVPLAARDLGEVTMPRRARFLTPQPAALAADAKPFSLGTTLHWDADGVPSALTLVCGRYVSTLYVDGTTSIFPSEETLRALGASTPHGRCSLALETSTTLRSSSEWSERGPWDVVEQTSSDGGYVALP